MADLWDKAKNIIGEGRDTPHSIIEKKDRGKSKSLQKKIPAPTETETWRKEIARKVCRKKRTAKTQPILHHLCDRGVH